MPQGEIHRTGWENRETFFFFPPRMEWIKITIFLLLGNDDWFGRSLVDRISVASKSSIFFFLFLCDGKLYLTRLESSICHQIICQHATLLLYRAPYIWTFSSSFLLPTFFFLTVTWYYRHLRFISPSLSASLRLRRLPRKERDPRTMGGCETLATPFFSSPAQIAKSRQQAKEICLCY